MEELVTITMVTVTMMFYRQNSMDSKKENRKKKINRIDLLKNLSGKHA